MEEKFNESLEFLRNHQSYSVYIPEVLEIIENGTVVYLPTFPSRKYPIASKERLLKVWERRYELDLTRPENPAAYGLEELIENTKNASVRFISGFSYQSKQGTYIIYWDDETRQYLGVVKAVKGINTDNSETLAIMEKHYPGMPIFTKGKRKE